MTENRTDRARVNQWQSRPPPPWAEDARIGAQRLRAVGKMGKIKLKTVIVSDVLHRDERSECGGHLHNLPKSPHLPTADAAMICAGYLRMISPIRADGAGARLRVIIKLLWRCRLVPSL